MSNVSRLQMKLPQPFTSLFCLAVVTATSAAPSIQPCDLVLPDDFVALGWPNDLRRISSEHPKATAVACAFEYQETKPNAKKSSGLGVTLASLPDEEMREFVNGFVAEKGVRKETAPFMQVVVIRDEDDMRCQTVRVFSAPPITACIAYTPKTIVTLTSNSPQGVPETMLKLLSRVRAAGG